MNRYAMHAAGTCARDSTSRAYEQTMHHSCECEVYKGTSFMHAHCTRSIWMTH